MRIELPFWVWFIYFDVTLWFVTIPAAIFFLLLGWYGARWLRWFRWAAFGAAALLAIPFPIAAAYIAFDQMRAAVARAQFERVLEKDETLAGLPLPAGSKIVFHDKEHLIVASIELPHVTAIRGLSLTGPLVWNAYGEVWSGTLARDQQADGWPCRAGPIEIGSGGTVEQCDLTDAHALFGYRLPAGTNIARGGASKSWAIRLPPDAGLPLPELGTEAPAGVTLHLTPEGRLERISSGHGQTIIISGVPLDSMNFYLRGHKVFAALAEPFPVAGHMQPAGTGVEIDLQRAGIALAGENWWLRD